MNYRHIYHAGNVCDVMKHSVLALLIDYLRGKDKPFAVLDTHAGCGLYDLRDERAQKTKEADAGILRLWQAMQQEGVEIPVVLRPYLDAIKTLNPFRELSLYPGSPSVARALLRKQDRLIACELHPEDVQELRRTFRDDAQAHIHHRDGYAALKALLPFAEKRGLILIDPPFEQPDEFDNLIAATKQIHALFPTAMLALWYPIKERPTIWKFHEGLAATKIPKMMTAEFMFLPEVRHDRLNGTGLVLVNPPWTLEENLKQLFAILHQTLATEAKGSVISGL